MLNPRDLVFRDESNNIRAKVEQRANLPSLVTTGHASASHARTSPLSPEVRRKHEQSVSGTGDSPSISTTSLDSSIPSALQRNEAAVLLSVSSPLTQLSIQTPIQEYAVSLFLQCPPQIMKSTGLVDPFYDFIPTAVMAKSRSSNESELGLALQAFSLAAWGQSESRDDLSVLAVQKCGEAISSLRRAISSPSERLSEDSLMAVKLLMGYEVGRPRRSNGLSRLV